MQKIDFSDCPTHGRADALRKALSFLHLSREGKKTKPAIVETGCIRNINWKFSDGHSTLLFGWYCQKYDGSLYTLEIDNNAMMLCKKITKEYEKNITYVLGDSASNLINLDLQKIDLLYLDSANDGEIALDEYNAAKHFLHEGSIVVVDDVVTGNKGRLVGPKLKSDGWDIELIENNEGGGGGSYYCIRK
tara:strand:+ start:4949 stop:5518 length:570 start_codon:yes stop_codon:yes gene_type:complete